MSYIDPRQKVLWYLDKLSQIRATGKTKAPVNVEIDLSNRCSHGCAWCHFAYTHTKGPLAGKRDKPAGSVAGGDLMGYGLAIRILEELDACGVQSITWTGGGEPTLHPDFDTIVEMAGDIGHKQGLYTHGGHINKERAATLKKHMTFVYISLDECDEVKFKQNKGVDRYWSVLSGIENLVHAKGDATIGIGFLLHPDNVDDIDRMVALGRRYGVDYVQFRPTIDYDQNEPGQLMGNADHHTWLNYAVQCLGRYDDPFVVADLDRFRMYRDWQGHGYKTCQWSTLQTVITPNGKVWRCLNKREHSEALLGDLTTESFSDIWKRAGSTCAVDGKCRVMCRGHIANITLDSLMVEPTHSSFI